MKLIQKLSIIFVSFFVLLNPLPSLAISLTGDFSSLTGSTSSGELIQSFSNSQETSFQGIYVGRDANGALINTLNYQGYYSSPPPVTYNIHNNGAPTPNLQDTNYRFFTAAFSSPGLYSLTVTQGQGDPVGAIYVIKGNTQQAYTGNALTNLYSFSDDSGGESGTAPWTIYYNQTDTSCTTTQFLIYEYGGSGDNLTGSYQISGPGSIAVNCESLGLTNADTQTALQLSSQRLRAVYNIQTSAIVNSLNYDCSLFDKNNICLSTGGRFSSNHGSSGNTTSALVIGAYRLNKNIRLGAWVDQNLSNNAVAGINLSNSQPLFGFFGVWSENPTGQGYEVKVSAGYGDKDLTITRDVIGTSEAGFGSTKINSQAFSTISSYGFRMSNDLILSPYLGFRYVRIATNSYSESANDNVISPLSYDRLNQENISVLAGLNVLSRLSSKIDIFGSLGLEQNIKNRDGRYSASGVDGLEPIDFNTNPQKTRVTGGLGVNYNLDKTQRLSINTVYREESFNSTGTTTIFATYMIGL